MERKTSVNDVHNIISKDYTEIYKSLYAILGEDNPFAKFSIGSGVYVWSDNRCLWTKMTDADDLSKSLIFDALNKTKQRISSKIGDEDAAKLFVTPDDSYIYYNDDNAEVKILLTGWGFKKPERRISGPDIGDVKKKNPIKLSFSFDGVKLPGFEFIIKLLHQEKHLKTDSSGYYNFSNLKVGEHLVLQDIKSGREYNFDVVEGKSEYDYDVTTFAEVCVNVFSDNTPLAGEPVNIRLKGKEFSAITDNSGTSKISVPYYAGESVEASVRNQVHQEILSSDVIDFTFKIEREEELFADIDVCVLNNSNPVINKEVTFIYHGNVYRGFTDNNGYLRKSVPFADNEVCQIDVEGYESQSRIIEKEKINKFVFSLDNVEPKEPIKVRSRIIVKTNSGEIVPDYPITVEYSEFSSRYTSNMNGYVYLDEIEEGLTVKASSCIDSNICYNYIIKKEQEEYEFILPDKPKEVIKVMFRDIHGNPIQCDKIVFQQNATNNLELTLDEQGDTWFDQGIFKVGETMHVRIDGWDNPESYDPIPFTLEDGIYEYLIQEDKPKTSWWMRVLEVLLILLATILLGIFLFPFFMASSVFFNEIIYN